MSLRSDVIRLAATLTDLQQRRLLLAALGENSLSQLMHQNYHQVLDVATNVNHSEYQQMVRLLHLLRKGDVVEITSQQPRTRQEKKTRRTVLKSWDEVKASGGSTQFVKVILEPAVSGQHKEGMIADYGADSGVYWQGTWTQQALPVVNLRRV
jgi:hypothetical protein